MGTGVTPTADGQVSPRRRGRRSGRHPRAIAARALAQYRG
ncbi:MAG: hypothetical protein AVDCRST_MAG49-476 [uncultured Thermomicrobiales bacterium]|uniref:Uncharacterized protein n=1 Tax=uncultured Thermomicrobiales bacterium TaxID=1645740 RepID=A0A6J4U2B7_9BACT|nr:MAG: hypothetical protein AVDCRST_MAG49-476 [uncultured Thermomicrobiales bacterium]